MHIIKVKLKNFKQFKDETILFNQCRNILIGENGVGKTSVLEAISYVLGANELAINAIGIQSLFNVLTINDFMAGNKDYENLPVLEIELFLSEDIENFKINGIHNSENKELNGLVMRISPNDEFSHEIADSLKKDTIFPFDFYKLEYLTFSGVSYNSYNRYLQYVHVDSTKINTKNATKRFIEKVYMSKINVEDRQRLNHAYREHSKRFSQLLSEEYGSKKQNEFDLILDSRRGNALLENLTIQQDDIDIRNMGRGDSVFINTEFALSNTSANIKVVLLEEPENHLSYLNMHKLIDEIIKADDKQTFIATHSNMISSRLDLKNSIFLSNSTHIKLEDLTRDTADYFQKSPHNNILNFILAEKAILVEGDAEFILLDSFYKFKYGEELYDKNITLISCGGKTFKRYLEVALLLDKKVAVITDNDRNYAENITKNYSKYINEKIIVFAPTDNQQYTFEVVIYNNNEKLLEEKLYNPQMNLGLQSYMLKNKAEAAFRLLKILEASEQIYSEFNIPEYISGAFEWIR